MTPPLRPHPPLPPPPLPHVRCAERCDIMRLVDRRFASYAFGVGRQRIIGVIHLGQVQIGGDFLASSFRVLEDQSHDLILGLDMLKRHQVGVACESAVNSSS